jgi:ribosomal protein S18 acetylase RimI-like enzyme
MELEIRDLTPGDLAAAGGVAGRALSDNPTFRWVRADDHLARVGGCIDLFVGMMESMPGPQLGAFVGRHVVGVAANAPPGTCVGEIVPVEMRTVPDDIDLTDPDARALVVYSLLCGHDLAERHWHVGPVSVEPGVQGLGIGGALLRPLCERMDEGGEVGWLETDKPDNVVFYRRHGFDVVEEVPTTDGQHAFTTWFMRRDPR